MRFSAAMAGVLLLVVGLSAIPVPGPLSLASSSVTAAAQQPDTPKAQVDINVNRGGGHAWWASPTWIAIGIIAVVLLIVIVAMIARGGGTTVIKD